MSEPVRSLAERRHDAWSDLCRVEDEMCRALEAAGVPYDDFECDRYDNSIELYTWAQPTDGWVAVLRGMGFTKVYWHPNCSNGFRGSQDPECVLFR